MKQFKFLVLSILIIASCTSNAQVTLDSGSVTGLLAVKKVNLVYDYSHVKIGEYATETDYLRHKQEDYSKEPGKFEQFRADWFNDRKNRYEPKFEEHFNKTGAKTGIQGKNNTSNEEVTLKIETEYIDIGFNGVVVTRPAILNLKCTFTDKNGNIIAVYSLKRVPGMGDGHNSFDSGARIADGYGAAARRLMTDLTKRLKKLK